MVISTYQKLPDSDSLWFSGEILGVAQAQIKLSGGPWLIIKDLGSGKYEVREVLEAQHGVSVKC